MRAAVSWILVNQMASLGFKGFSLQNTGRAYDSHKISEGCNDSFLSFSVTCTLYITTVLLQCLITSFDIGVDSAIGKLSLIVD